MYISLMYRLLKILLFNMPRLETFGMTLVLAKNRKFYPAPHLAPSFGVTPFEFMEKLYGSWN